MITFTDFGHFEVDRFNWNCSLVDWGRVERLEEVDDKVRFVNSGTLTKFDVYAALKTVVLRKKSQPAQEHSY